MPDHAEAWEKVVRKLRAGTMPPQGAPQPDEARTGVARRPGSRRPSIAPSAARPNPGRPALHRLNRAEYQNAIRDLLALDVDVASLLPRRRFELRLRQRRRRARRLAGAARALPGRRREDQRAGGRRSGASRQRDETYRVRFDLTQTRHIDGLPLGTRGGTLVRETFPLDGEYIIKPKLWRTNVGFIRGLAYPHQVEITVDGARVHLVTVGTPEDFATSLMGPQNAVKIIEERMQVRVPIKAGPRTIGVAFVEKSEAMSPTLLRPYLSTLDPVDSEGVPQLEAVTVSGPFSVDRPRRHAEPPPHFQLPASAARGTASSESKGAPSSRAGNDTACAKQILSALARLAYRRPVGDADLGPLLAFYETGRQKKNFDAGIQLAVERMLSDPQFVFRAERDPADLTPGTAFRVSDLELASRLSFFLWSSIPDEPLLALASRGKLRDAGGARATGPADDARPAGRRRWSATSPGSGCTSAISRTSCPARTSFRTSTTTCGRRFSARRSCSSRASCARTAACSIC